MRDYKLYMHTNKINGKKYIGLTRQDVYRRWRNGEGYRGSIAFYSAIQKYGWDSFYHEIIFTGLTQKEAQDKEIEMIKKYNTIVDGYNISQGGKAVSRGMKVSEETRKRMSESHKKMSAETREKMRMAQLGRKHPPEVRKKISQSNKGRKISEETRVKISKSMSGENSPWFGRRHTQEEIGKMKEAAKNRGDEYRKKLSEIKKGVKLSKEHARNCGIAHRVPVLQYDLNGVLIREWVSQTEASIHTGISQGRISKCCSGRQNKVGEYVFKYKELMA